MTFTLPSIDSATIDRHLADTIPTTTALRGAELPVLIGAFELFTHTLGLPDEGDALELWHELHGVPGWQAAASWLHRFLGVWEEAESKPDLPVMDRAARLWEQRAVELEAQRKRPRDDAYAFHRFYRGARA